MQNSKFDNGDYSSFIGGTEKDANMTAALEAVYFAALVCARDPSDESAFSRFSVLYQDAYVQRQSHFYPCEVGFRGKYGMLRASGLEETMKDLSDRRKNFALKCHSSPKHSW